MTNETKLVVTEKKQFQFGIKSIPIEVCGNFVLSETWTENRTTRFLNRIFLFKSKRFVWDPDGKNQNCSYWEPWNRIMKILNQFGIFEVSDFWCRDQKKSTFSRIIFCMCSSAWDFHAKLRPVFMKKVEPMLEAFFGKIGVSELWWKYQKKKFLLRKNRCKCNTYEWDLAWRNQTCRCVGKTWIAVSQNIKSTYWNLWTFSNPNQESHS